MIILLISVPDEQSRRTTRELGNRLKSRTLSQCSAVRFSCFFFFVFFLFFIKPETISLNELKAHVTRVQYKCTDLSLEDPTHSRLPESPTSFLLRLLFYYHIIITTIIISSVFMFFIVFFYFYFIFFISWIFSAYFILPRENNSNLSCCGETKRLISMSILW